eukprot:5780465-Lingulodinium_polyedra.AAC.1
MAINGGTGQSHPPAETKNMRKPKRQLCPVRGVTEKTELPRFVLLRIPIRSYSLQTDAATLWH